MKLAVAPQETQRQTTRRTYIGLAAATAVGVTCALFIPEQLELPQSIACDKATYTYQPNGTYLVNVEWSGKNDGQATKLTITYPTAPNGILAKADNHQITDPETAYLVHPVFGSGDTAANSIQVILHDDLGNAALCKNIQVVK